MDHRKFVPYTTCTPKFIPSYLHSQAISHLVYDEPDPYKIEFVGIIYDMVQKGLIQQI